MHRLVIGDIHGCHAELLDLIDAAGLSSGDEIIALGDIVDRGPDTPRIVEFFRATPGARSLLGNHERKHIRSSQGLVRPAISQTIAKAQLGDAYPAAVAFLETFPLWIELDEAILAHGFWEPGVPLSSQRETVLAGVMTGEAYLERRYARPWHELYDGPRPIVVGHRDYLGTGQPFIVDGRVFAIDTGCVRGGRLTGLVLPEFRLVSVPSRGNHWARVYAEHRRRAACRPSAAWSAEDDAVALRIVERVSVRHAAILDDLRRESGWDGLSPSDQARAYAARVEGLPARAWLHAARKGRLAPEDVRRRLQTPAAARRCLETLGPDLGDPA